MTNNVSILHDFFDITNFTVYVTAHRGPNFKVFRLQLELKSTDTFLFMCTHNVVNTCYIH